MATLVEGRLFRAAATNAAYRVAATLDELAKLVPVLVVQYHKAVEESAWRPCHLGQNHAKATPEIASTAPMQSPTGKPWERQRWFSL